ncbi:MAG: ATP-binding protein [Candidatus Aminicenantes bacterium]|nr:ATP-binding protein [Candidatus Aminicenantes bacterium]MDH5714015.1 ATP-binding protein [Candidatus Aminicenantes bacterium]
MKESIDYEKILRSSPTIIIKELKECHPVIRRLLLRFQKRLNLTDDEVYNLQLAVGEICANAIEHGNKCAPDKSVRLSYAVHQHRLIFQVEDEGEGFNPEDLPDPTKPENLLKKRGRGIFLACSLVDAIIFQDKGRRVILVKKLTQSSSPA